MASPEVPKSKRPISGNSPAAAGDVSLHIAMGRLFEKIIVGSNGAPEAEHAVEVAISLAESVGAKVVLLGVVAHASAEAQAEGYALESPAAAKQRLKTQLARMADQAKARGVEMVIEVDEGDPERQIEKHASREGADLIVVGHRNVSRVRHWLERSTGEALLHHAKTSILVVHTPEKKHRLTAARGVDSAPAHRR
jgi:nucleotide-binding universal stress UspA family protein